LHLFLIHVLPEFSGVSPELVVALQDLNSILAALKLPFQSFVRCTNDAVHHVKDDYAEEEAGYVANRFVFAR
jgi:hypothetical protein